MTWTWVVLIFSSTETHIVLILFLCFCFKCRLSYSICQKLLKLHSPCRLFISWYLLITVHFCFPNFDKKFFVLISVLTVLILFLFSSKSHCSFKIVLIKKYCAVLCLLSFINIGVFFSCSIFWPVFTRLFRIIIAYIESKNQHHFMPFLSLKAHRQISEKWCFEKHCSCNQACQFSGS